jgi:hypothetical protein
VPVSFNCPKCGQKLTLTTSKPGDWLDCPACEAAIQVPGAAPKPAPARAAAPARPAPRPAAPLDLPDEADEPAETPGLWADKRVQLGALAGGVGLLLVGLLVAALAFQKPKKAPEQVRNDPAPSATPQAAPALPQVAPPVVTPTPATTPTPKPRPKDEPPKAKPAPRVDPSSEPKEDDPPKPVTPPRPPPDYSKLDQFGNPIDQNTGLARQDEFKGQRFLFWSPHTGAGELFFAPKNPLWEALEDKGFAVRKEFGKFDSDWLKEVDQLWILSTASESVLAGQRKAVPDLAALRAQLKERFKGGVPPGSGMPKDWTADDLIEMTLGDIAVSVSPAHHLTPKDYDAIVAFAKAGKGLCLLADNDPFTYEANELARRLFGVGVRGNYPATKIAYVKNGQLTPEQIKKYRGDYEVPEHPLLTGVNFVYEGITTSNVPESPKLDVALRASDGKPVIAVSKVPGLRVIIDCGFTRYCHGPSDRVSFICMTAGTPRLAQNMAAYLAGKTAAAKPE